MIQMTKFNNISSRRREEFYRIWR